MICLTCYCVADKLFVEKLEYSAQDKWTIQTSCTQNAHFLSAKHNTCFHWLSAFYWAALSYFITRVQTYSL